MSTVTTTNNPTKTKTILIVDDDTDYLSQVEARLRRAGFDVLIADSQSQAEEVLAAHKPDLAVVDLMLEHTDSGIFLSHHIKKIDPRIPVILVTGVTAETGIELDAATEEERSWVKADVLLDKPIRFEQLMREVERLLKGH